MVDRVEYDNRVHAHVGCPGGGTVHIEGFVYESGKAKPVAGSGPCDKCAEWVYVELSDG